MIFKYSELRKFLNYINNNFKVWSLEKWDGSNGIILRHDVDFDVKAAYDLAIVEKDCNIDSTFFIMTSSNTYNPMSEVNRKLIKEMSHMGFEIGLHFDPSIYPNSTRNILEEHLNNEIQIISSIIEKKVKSISVHIPSVHGEYPLFSGYNNAYDPKIFSNEVYISDSLMRFSKDIYEFVKKSESKPIQILLHPMYYTLEEKTIPEIFYKFIHKSISSIDETFQINSTYKNSMKTDLVTYFVNRKLDDHK